MPEDSRDRVLLIVTALTSSFAAWVFWHYLSQDAFDVLLTAASICLIGENWRLRRALRRLDREDRNP